MDGVRFQRSKKFTLTDIDLHEIEIENDWIVRWNKTQFIIQSKYFREKLPDSI